MKLQLNESKFRYILTEIVKEVLLLESKMSLDDIYDKYYSDIDKKIFLAAVKADPTSKYTADGKLIGIGEYTKWILNLVRQGNWKPVENVVSDTIETLTTFHKLKERNQIKDVDKKNINNFTSVDELYNFLETLSPTKSRSEIKQEEATKVYEDEQWLIIIPHTEKAACLYGKGTKWCTAAVNSDNEFDTYNEEGYLYININKKNKHKYQFHFEKGEFMNEQNISVEPTEIGLSQGVLDYYKSIGYADYFITIDDMVSYIQRGDYSIFNQVIKYSDVKLFVNRIKHKFLVDSNNQLIGNTWYDYIMKDDNSNLFWVNKIDNNVGEKWNYLIKRNGRYECFFGDINNLDTWFDYIEKKGNWFNVMRYVDEDNVEWNFLDMNGNELLDNWVDEDEFDKYYKQIQQQYQPLNEMINRLVRNYKRY